MEWRRSLRPAQALAERLRNHRRMGAIARVLHPCSGLFDAVAVRSLPRICRKPRGAGHIDDASAADVLPLLRRAARSVALAPDYEEQSLTWLLEQASHAKAFGQLRCRIVSDQQEQPVGWFIYYTKPGGQAQVLQLGALPGETAIVLEGLFRDAWEAGAAAVAGQLDPLHLTEMSQAHCRFTCGGYGVLAQSRDDAILAALHRGDALISRLDGEWWMRFGIDRKLDW